jgi:endonuclease III
MTRREEHERARLVLDRYGRTYANELGIHVERNTPTPLFQLLVAALLFSARINAKNAAQAARALIDAGLSTPKKMAAASWQDRVDVITWHGYKRYDESASRELGQTAELVLARYHGDLRQLREAAGRNVTKERVLLQEFKGIGEVGADIFLREVQVVWDEAYPYADARVLHAATKIGLPGSPSELASLVKRSDFARFAAGLVRIDLKKSWDELRGAMNQDFL